MPRRFRLRSHRSSGSLRQAILDANGLASSQSTIVFSLPPGPQTINLLTPLPPTSHAIVAQLDATRHVTMVSPAVGGQDNLSALKGTGARTLTFSGAINSTGNIQVHAGLLRLRSGAMPSNGSQPFGPVRGVDGEPLADPWPYLVKFNLAALAAGISEQVICNFNELPAGENAWAGAASIVVAEELGERRLAGPFAQHAAEVGQVFDDPPGRILLCVSSAPTGTSF